MELGVVEYVIRLTKDAVERGYVPPSLDKPNVPSGVSEACLMNDHTVCTNPRCGCSCHHPEANPNVPDANSATGGPENSCPKCGVKRPANELYCRVDGTRLTSLACNMCGRGMNLEDLYCFNCGAQKGTVGKVKVPQVVTVPDVANYEQQVLRGLQEELSVQQDQGDGKDTPRQVVEQPGGTQGSFKLVSKPNPNKLRTPVGQGDRSPGPVKATGPIRPSIRLPIKPS